MKTLITFALIALLGGCSDIGSGENIGSVVSYNRHKCQTTVTFETVKLEIDGDHMFKLGELGRVKGYANPLNPVNVLIVNGRRYLILEGY